MPTDVKKPHGYFQLRSNQYFLRLHQPLHHHHTGWSYLPSMLIILYFSLLPCALIYCLFHIAGEWARPNLHTDSCCKARIRDTAYSGVSRMFQTPRLLLGYISTAPFAFTNWVSEQSIALCAVCVHSFL